MASPLAMVVAWWCCPGQAAGEARDDGFSLERRRAFSLYAVSQGLVKEVVNANGFLGSRIDVGITKNISD